MERTFLILGTIALLASSLYLYNNTYIESNDPTKQELLNIFADWQILYNIKYGGEAEAMYIFKYLKNLYN